MLNEVGKTKGKLRFTFAGIEYEWEGDPIAIVPFIQQLSRSIGKYDSSQMKLVSEHASTLTARTPRPQSKFTKQGKVDYPPISDEDVKQYILSKPDYRHTLFEVQMSFYNRIFKSRRETQLMYHRTAKQLRRIRNEIATEQKGKFQEILVEGGVKQFVFKRELSEYKIVA